MILANIAAAFGKRYPYGGQLRHEVYLFPFVVLCVLAGLEGLRCSVPARWSSRRLWAAAVGLAVTASIPLGMSRMRIDAWIVPFGAS